MGSLQIILWRIQMAEVCSLRDFTLLLQLNWENKIKNMKVTKIILLDFFFICNCPPTFNLRLFLQLSI